jgi:hypothetical protein
MRVEDLNISSVEFVWTEYHVAETATYSTHSTIGPDPFCCDILKKMRAHVLASSTTVWVYR